MTKIKRILFSPAATAAVYVLALLPLHVGDYIFLPGVAFASLFWPQGLHSGNDGSVAFAYVAWGAMLVFWIALFFVIVTLVDKARSAKSG
jgi:hypothetical protein